MRKQALFLFWTLLLGLVFSSNGTIAYALDSSNSGNFEDGVSYIFIHYNGEDQEVKVNERLTLSLTGWADQTKTTVKGKLGFQTDSTEAITLNVNEQLNELKITDTESIHYRITVSGIFKADIVKSENLSDVNTSIKQNNNGTSIEEIKKIDEFGTVIETKGFIYYSTNESKQKIVITKEKYESLNTVSDSTLTTKDTSSLVTKTAITTNSNSITTESNKQVQPLVRYSTSTSSTPVSTKKPSVKYSSYVQKIGWQKSVRDGALSGTVGQGKPIEALRISIENTPFSGGVIYRTNVQKNGWLPYVSAGKISGTTGENKRVEAIQIKLTGEMAKQYDLYYRVHAQSFGWLGWAKNGEPAGTTGLTKRVEAIETVLIKKGEKTPGSTEKRYLTPPSVVYSTHVQTYGWLKPVKDGTMSGTLGKAKRLEAIKIELKNLPYSGGITYSTHVQSYGWINNISNGKSAGSSGQGKRLEGIKINLTGDIAKYYDVYYRVHSQSFGWLGWAKNGMKAGTEGLSKRLEAIEIKLVPKGQGARVDATKAYKEPIKIFLDPGHGGRDPGAVAGGVHEADINLAVAKKAKALLVARGYKVYMSRTDNRYLSLLERSEMANGLKSDLFISIHVNSTGSKTTDANGIESYYYEYDPDYPSKINADMHNNKDRIKKSVTLTNFIQDNMIQYTGANNRGTDGQTFSVVREAAMPATLIELGFINNTKDRQKLVTSSYQQKLAKAIADGVDEYFRVY
jgi:N-acetylmuramoyl-L-alanine amidase